MHPLKTSFFSSLEAKRLLRLGMPIFIAQLSGVGMNLADTIMSGQASAVDMAAVAVACSVWHPISLFGIGVLLTISPLSAQLVGEGKSHEAPHIMRQGIWVALILAIPLMLLFYIISLNMGAFKLSPALEALSGGYLRAVLWSLPGYFLFICVRGFVEGFSLTRPAMLVATLALLLNIPINYMLIYGKFGLPALGAVGCGVATTICFTFMGLAMTAYVCWASRFKKLGPLFKPMLKKSFSNTADAEQVHQQFDVKCIKRIFRIGLPGALAMLFEVGLFATAALAIAPLGTNSVAGHQVATSVASVIFMLPLSISQTTTISIGHYLGAGQITRARLTIWTTIVIGLCIACASSLLIYIFRSDIAYLYNDDVDVVSLATVLIVYAASFQIMDSMQIISVGILRGYNDTKILFIICLITYWVIGFPLGYTLCHTDIIAPAMGPAGFWWGFITALSINCLCFGWRIIHLNRLNSSEVHTKISA